MRRALGILGIAVLLGAWGALGTAETAAAAVTYGLAFRSTDILGDTLPGVSGGGTRHLSLSLDTAHACNAATGAGCPVLDILLITDVPLIGASVSVGFDPTGGLDPLVNMKWFGQGVVFNAMGEPSVRFAPMVPGSSAACGFDSCSSFDGAIMLAPNAPPSLPAGTYHIGTVVWDTSGAMQQVHSVFAKIRPSLDGTGAVLNGMVVVVTGSEVLQTGTLNIVPEPSTAALLGLGLVATLLSRRRR
jgi:PEP-CTERM motif